MSASATDAAVHTVGLTKVYKDFWGRDKVRALDNLDLTIHRGEVFGLLGPNGSGKSTTIKLLLGLIFPSRGSASVLGKPAGDTGVNEKIGFLPEESYLYRFLNGEEILKFYGKLFKIDRRTLNRRVPELLDIVGLDAKSRKRKLREYSKGMARRIGLAQALINNPDLILLDEPTTGLDPIGTREMKDLIISLKNQGKTVLLCSHLLADVQDVCDRIIILFRGKAQQLDTDTTNGQQRPVFIAPVKDILQRRDITSVEASGLSPAQIEQLRQMIQQMGINASVTHPTTTLEDLFIRIVRENTPAGQSSVGSGRTRNCAARSRVMQNSMTTLALFPPIIEQHLGWILLFIIIALGLAFGLTDLARLSLKRIWAISGVCFAESIRRRVLLITPLAILGVIIISQLQRPNDEQDVIRQTTKMAVFATGLLVAISTIILACTNLPREIENRVIFTIVTKPTTRLEIVLGKVVGFARVSAVILLIMGIFSYGYLELRSWTLQRAIAARLESKDISPTSVATLTYYRDAGLLNAKTLETPDEMQIYSRLPEESGTRRYVYGSGEGSLLVPFDITPEIQKALDPRDGGGQIGLLINIGYVKRAGAAKAPAATMAVTTGPTTKPYYGPFILSPEDRAKLMRGSQPTGAPFVGIDVMDSNQNTIGAAAPLGGGKSFELGAADALTQLRAVVDSKLASKMAGRVYVRVVGMSPDVEYFIDPATAPPVMMKTVEIVNNQPVVKDIPQASNPQHPAKAAPILFQTRTVTAGQQLRGGAEHIPVAIYQFRDVGFSPGADDRAPFELHVGVERSAAEDQPTEVSEQPTRVAVRVHNLASGQTSDETIVQPESNHTLLFTMPAGALAGGNFDVLVRCVTPGDFLGLQDKSLVLLTSRQFFAWNLFKSMLILWLMAILITTVSIFASTFLSWPIAVVLTIVILLGHWGVEQLGDATAPGIGSQVVNDFGLKNAAKAEAVRATVERLSSFLNFISTILPDISKFPAVEDIERGIAIPSDKMRDAAGVALGFGLPLVLLAYVVLKNKEVAP